jgi:hypothetical protein
VNDEEAEVTIGTLGSPDSAVAMPGHEYAPDAERCQDRTHDIWWMFRHVDAIS